MIIIDTVYMYMYSRKLSGTCLLVSIIVILVALLRMKSYNNIQCTLYALKVTYSCLL